VIDFDGCFQLIQVRFFKAKENYYKYYMRYLFTFIFILVLASPVGSCLSQVLDTLTLDLDSVITADVTYLYSRGVIQERIYYKGVVVDIRVVYIWREGLLLRREWWRGGKRISSTIEL